MKTFPYKLSCPNCGSTEIVEIIDAQQEFYKCVPCGEAWDKAPPVGFPLHLAGEESWMATYLAGEELQMGTTVYIGPDNKAYHR